jgi:hypothetical protein
MQYGVSVVEAIAVFPNPVNTVIVPFPDDQPDCRRLFFPDLIIFPLGNVGPKAGDGVAGGGGLELLDVGLWIDDAVVRAVELVIAGAELVVGSTVLVDDGAELEVDWIELDELEVDEELWVSDAEVDAGVIFMKAGSVKLVIKSVGCVLRFAWFERSVNSKAILAA